MHEELNPVWSRRRSPTPSPDSVQETAWVNASSRGDTLAFNRLVLKWEKTVYNVALRMLQDREEAAEATQEIFLSAFRGIRRFRKDAKFSTWIYRIAVNHCISRARRRPPGIPVPLESQDPGASPPKQLRVTQTQEGELLRSETASRVHGALAVLPPDQRAVIELKFFQEMTFEEIAGVLEIPLSTVKSRAYSGLELLKDRLAGCN